jgi:hypothetical protein
VSKEILHLIPRPDMTTSKEKICLLRSKYKVITNVKGCGYEYTSIGLVKRHVVNMKYLIKYLNYDTIYRIFLHKEINCITNYFSLTWCEFDRKNELNFISTMILWCKNKEYISYLINKVIEEDKVNDIVSILKGKIFCGDINRLMEYNVLDNPIFRSLHERLSTHSRRELYIFEILDKYFSVIGD